MAEFKGYQPPFLLTDTELKNLLTMLNPDSQVYNEVENEINRRVITCLWCGTENCSGTPCDYSQEDLG